MPNYVKFIKDILSRKRQLGEFETVALTEGYTTMLMNKLPPKLKNQGSFTILYSIGNHYVSKTLCDLGASINLMPMSIFRKLGIRKARTTIVTLQLADNSYAHPKGKIEDVLVRIDKEVPIILGKMFLATSRTLINVQKGELTMRVNDQQITFNVFVSMKCVDENEECHIIEFLDTVVEKEFAKFCYSNSNSDGNPFELTEPEMIGELCELMEIKQFKC
ncbi:uncharacterized protein LOC108458620 [Gossypium arboreum]|uniref:uncharacterized protein LOC108458620 n=1 Tax=Gossypium arboreum TaxID=29729 RepID=UPI00081947DD|nr:uncharacterized protein LOC108458620 [Gossypium arboreum]